MFDNLTKSLHDVTDKIEDFGLSTVEYYKLRLFKSSMKGAISLVNLLVFGSLSLFVLLFLSIGAAMWLGTFFEEGYVGFLLIGALYGVALICMFVFGRKIIERKMLQKSSGLFYDEDDIDPKEAAQREIADFVARRKEETILNDTLEEETVSR